MTFAISGAQAMSDVLNGKGVGAVRFRSRRKYFSRGAFIFFRFFSARVSAETLPRNYFNFEELVPVSDI